MKYPTIEICSPDGRAMYITIDGYTFYIDNTTDEQIMECWKSDGTDVTEFRRRTETLQSLENRLEVLENRIN